MALLVNFYDSMGSFYTITIYNNCLFAISLLIRGKILVFLKTVKDFQLKIHETFNGIYNTDKIKLSVSLVSRVGLILSIGYRSKGDDILK